MEISKRVYIHRLYDTIAVYVMGTKEIIYFPPNLAVQLAEQLIDYAKDCEEVSFTKSEKKTITIEGDL